MLSRSRSLTLWRDESLSLHSPRAWRRRARSRSARARHGDARTRQGDRSAAPQTLVPCTTACSSLPCLFRARRGAIARDVVTTARVATVLQAPWRRGGWLRQRGAPSQFFLILLDLRRGRARGGRHPARLQRVVGALQQIV